MSFDFQIVYAFLDVMSRLLQNLLVVTKSLPNMDKQLVTIFSNTMGSGFLLLVLKCFVASLQY
jgi:hypothetical protein